jgi:hypothetical protein
LSGRFPSVRRKAGQSKRRFIPIRFTRAACDWICSVKFKEQPRVCPYWGQAGVSCKDLITGKTGSNLMSRRTYIDILIFRSPHKARVSFVRPKGMSHAGICRQGRHTRIRAYTIFTVIVHGFIFCPGGWPVQSAEEQGDDAVLRLAFGAGGFQVFVGFSNVAMSLF